MEDFKYTKVLQLQETPTLEPDEVLIKVFAATIKLLDVIEPRIDKANNLLCVYVGNKDEKVLIRECSGHIIKVGRHVTEWKIGDEVCALVYIRGYAEEVVVSSERVFRVPDCYPLEYAAGLPMATCVTYYAINKLLDLNKGDLLVVKILPLRHVSFKENSVFSVYYQGVVTMQMISLGVMVVTAFDNLVKQYKENGADAAINDNKENIVEEVLKMSRMKGADAVLSFKHRINPEFCQCVVKNGVILRVWNDKYLIPQVEVDPRIKVCDIETLLTIMDKESLGSLVREALQCPWTGFMRLKTIPPSDLKAIEWETEMQESEKIILTNKNVIIPTNKSVMSDLYEKIRDFIF